MKDLFEKNKPAFIVGTIIIILAIGAGIYFMNGSSAANTAQETTEGEEVDEPIPTVDPSVKVAFETLNDGKDVKISVENPPANTELIEVSLTYEREDPETGEPMLDGQFKDIDPTKGQKDAEIKLGTCSATCTYHILTTGEINAVLLFKGEYGEQIFEKTYQI